MYDKFGQILRIETTSNDIPFFQHSRTVECRYGTSETKMASMRKTIHSLDASNRRYLEFIPAYREVPRRQTA
ncbi:MAG: hypothetical protein RLZZ165_1864 [Bacteroidota bacterium]